MADTTPMLSLAAFPFPLTELLLPGERKEMHLFESRFISLFELAQQQGGLASQMLFTDDGSTLAIGALLSVEEWTRRDVGLNVIVRAVGRVRLIDVHGTEPYISGLFEPLRDAPLTTDAQRRALRAQQAELYELHADCRAARTRLLRACEEDGTCLIDGELPAPAAAAAAPSGSSASTDTDTELAPSARVTWGHELTSPDSGFASALDEQVASATAAVLAGRERAIAGGRAPWDGASAEDIELGLTSMLACACFPAAQRVRALALDDVSVRFDNAIELLQEQRRMLAAKTALLSAFGSPRGE